MGSFPISRIAGALNTSRMLAVASGLSRQRRGESREVGGAVMVDVVGLQHHARELLQQVILFVGGAVRADDADRLPAMLLASFLEALSDQLKRLFPGGWRQLPILANQRLGQAVFVIGEIESVAALDAEEIAVDAALVAIVSAHNLHAGLGAAHAQSGLASVGAVGAGRADVVHLPGTRLIAISSRSQRAHRTDVDAHAALFALQMIFFIGSDDRAHAAVLHSERPDVHALAAHPHAAIAKNAARPVEVHHRRPLLLFLVVLGLHVLRFRGAVGKCHVLQFALAAGIAHRTIQRMIAQQQFHHALARLLDLRRCRW